VNGPPKGLEKKVLSEIRGKKHDTVLRGLPGGKRGHRSPIRRIPWRKKVDRGSSGRVKLQEGKEGKRGHWHELHMRRL